VLGVGLLRNTPCLLPPDRLDQTHRTLLKAYPGALHVSDEDIVDAGQPRRGDASTLHAILRARTPAIDVDLIAALAFAPVLGALEHYPKRWGQLVRTARSLARRLQLGAEITVVATVPPQHMYGLEMSIMVPLTTGGATVAERPLFPADIRAVLARTPGAKLLVSTPVHLAAIASTAGAWPAVSRVVSATAPLAASLAARIESLLDSRVYEVYGTTETGALATRRTLDGPAWSWLDGVEARERADGRVDVRFEPFPDELTLPDKIELCENGFRLLGPAPDLVKVAGKRASLAALNRHLRSIPGVEAGVFLSVADPIDTFGRPMAVVVAPTLSREDILKGLQGRMDPLFLPRRIIMAADLPLDRTGQPCRETLAAMFAGQPGDPASR
jgi:acyl-coenzyme A synthetase/AMP-(fatty) acid ligase